MRIRLPMIAREMYHGHYKQQATANLFRASGIQNVLFVDKSLKCNSHWVLFKLSELILKFHIITETLKYPFTN
jgi:hypothetical protein